MVTRIDPPALEVLRLLHLVSPSVPTGGFAYSQGIEWAVEAGWIRTVGELRDWLFYQLQTTVQYLDIPILQRCFDAVRVGERDVLRRWIGVLHASRETSELLLEERQRGRALVDWLVGLKVDVAAEWRAELAQSQVAGFAAAGVAWGISLADVAAGYAWSWLENLVLSAVKIIPLGQTAGQCLLHELLLSVPAVVAVGLVVADDALGASSPAVAIASSRHETQYTRLFRS